MDKKITLHIVHYWPLNSTEVSIKKFISEEGGWVSRTLAKNLVAPVIKWKKVNPDIKVCLWWNEHDYHRPNLVDEVRFVGNINDIDIRDYSSPDQDILLNDEMLTMSSGREDRFYYNNFTQYVKLKIGAWWYEIIRYKILTRQMVVEPENYHCVVKGLAEPFDILCALNKQPLYIERLNSFGILFARSPEAEMAVDDCFVIVNGKVPEIKTAIEKVFIDFNCLLFGDLRTIALEDNNYVSDYIYKYLKNWCVRNLPLLVQFHILLREAAASPEAVKNQGIRLKGTVLGLVSNGFMPISQYQSLILKFPLALLEECEFKGHGEGEYSIKSYQAQVEKMGIKSVAASNEEEKKSMCFMSLNIPVRQEPRRVLYDDGLHYEGVLWRVRKGVENYLKEHYNVSIIDTIRPTTIKPEKRKK